MVQPKYSPKEALQRAKLLMKYDTGKTLTENLEKQKLTELFWVPFLLGAGAVSAAWAWWNNTNTFSEPAQKVRQLIKSCPKLLEKGQPTQGVDHAAAANEINAGITTWQGTDEDAIKAAIEKMKTPADFCKMAEIYNEKYTDLYADLDGDFSGSDWTTYIYDPLYKIMQTLPTDTSDNTTTADTTTQISKYNPCPETFPIKMGCKNEIVRKIQSCLNISADSAFGPQTKGALEAKGLPGEEITQNTLDKVCGSQSKQESPFEDEDEDVTS